MTGWLQDVFHQFDTVELVDPVQQAVLVVGGVMAATALLVLLTAILATGDTRYQLAVG